MDQNPLLCIALGLLIAQGASLLTTVYLHRGSTHRSVVFNRWVEAVMQLGLWLTTGINRLEWVAIHLCHHAHADKDGDPHSPVLLGFWKVQLGNVFLYRKAAKDPRVLAYGKNIRLTLAERTIFRSGTLGLLVGIAVLWYAFGLVPALAIAGTHTFLYVVVISGLVNGYCHVWGYKNFPGAHAFNNRWVAWFTGGEGLHNNHHHAPGNPSLRVKWSEVDLGWLVIRGLCALNLARICPAD